MPLRGTLLPRLNSPINAIEIPEFASGFLRLIIDSNAGNKEETMNIRKNMDCTDMYEALDSATTLLL